MSEIIKYRVAQHSDLAPIKALLTKYSLPVSDISEDNITFIVALADSGELIGCIGLEQHEKDALLRSFAVDTLWRNKKIGQSLLHKLFYLAKEYGVNHLHLLTTTADKFFLRSGFVASGREELPLSISKTTEFTSLCPSSSVYMSLKNIEQLIASSPNQGNLFFINLKYSHDFKFRH
jgi:amino-acid N-acetyltransferase